MIVLILPLDDRFLCSTNRDNVVVSEESNLGDVRCMSTISIETLVLICAGIPKRFDLREVVCCENDIIGRREID